MTVPSRHAPRTENAARAITVPSRPSVTEKHPTVLVLVEDLRKLQETFAAAREVCRAADASGYTPGGMTDSLERLAAACGIGPSLEPKNAVGGE